MAFKEVSKFKPAGFPSVLVPQISLRLRQQVPSTSLQFLSARKRKKDI